LGNKRGKHLKLFPNWQKVFFFCKTIEIYKTNTYVKEYQHVFQKCGRGSFGLVLGHYSITLEGKSGCEK